MAKKYHTPLSEQAENQTSNEPNGHIFPSNGENLVPPTTPQRGQNSNPRPDSDRLSPLPLNNNSNGGYGGARPRRPSGDLGQRRIRRSSGSGMTEDEVRHQRRRVDSLNLETPYHSDSYDPTVNRYQSTTANTTTMPEACTIVEGQELYLHFLHEQVRNAGLSNFDSSLEDDLNLGRYHSPEVHTDERTPNSPNRRRRQRTMSMNLENFHDPVWRQTGRELQALAEDFARSRGRALVLQQAQQVNVTSLDREKFCGLLEGLFENGQITRERILVLFFFCSDVAILAIRNGLTGLVSNITRWSLDFIRHQICSWVQENGGWASVLRSGLNVMQQTAMIGACAAVFVCCVIYIRKNW